jgi:hypothetical protein
LRGGGQVEAYFCSRSFPAYGQPYQRVEVKLSSGDFIVLAERPLPDGGTWEEEDRWSAGQVLTHFLGRMATEEEVRRLVKMPGKLLARLTPGDLRGFQQMRLF